MAITSDPGEAARAPMGDAIVGDVGLALERLVELVPAESDRELPEPRPAPGDPAPATRRTGSAARRRWRRWPTPGREDAIAVVETPSSTLALRNRLRISRPGSYYFCASGGLGFGISAAVGVQLAQPDRPVVCVLGEGSAQYGITALWSAVAYKAPVTFLVLRNDEYMILKWFATLEQVTGAPGLDLPGLDVAAVARGYGMPAARGVRARGADRGAARGDRRRRRPAAGAGAGGHGDVAGVGGRGGLRPAAGSRLRRPPRGAGPRPRPGLGRRRHPRAAALGVWWPRSAPTGC